ncbi:MAG TPA: AAA family ATPase [Rhizomicrobium sp.]|jgi:pilus assembly protein CpaE|nr:AAA family ATPase [Rhizomicrobium sp.]
MTPGLDQGEAFGAAPHERPVPRISIHAFCEFPDTSSALERAAADRRLAKANTTVEMGGLQAAIEHYTGQVTPNLLVVETRLQGLTALDEIDRLAEVCDPATKVIIVGRANDVELYRGLIRRGASEYLVAPINPLHLIEVVSGLYLDPDAAPVGRVVSFVGARGGVGSSTLAHNVGFCISELFHINTTIVDFDLPFGTTGLDFNEEPAQGVAEALSSPERLDDVLLERLLIKASDHLSLFASPAAVDREYDADPAAFETVLDSVRQMSPCVVIDIPHVWTPWVKQTLLASDDIVIVASPDLASLRNAKGIIDVLRASRTNDAAPRLVLNQVGIPKRPEIPVKDFASTMGLAPALILPFEPALYGAAANNGQMLLQTQPKSATAEGIRRLSEALTGRSPSVETQKSASSALLSIFSGKKRA